MNARQMINLLERLATKVEEKADATIYGDVSDSLMEVAKTFREVADEMKQPPTQPNSQP